MEGFEICLEGFGELFGKVWGTRLGHVWEASRTVVVTCLGHVWNTIGTIVGCFQIVFSTCLHVDKPT